MFDDYLRGRADRTGEPFRAFDAGGDYDAYVDGRPRYDGVRSFLDSRGIELPQGSPEDSPGAETVDGLGNRKNDLVLELIHQQGVQAYEGSVRYVRAVRTLASRERWCRRARTAATYCVPRASTISSTRHRRHRRRPGGPGGQAGARQLSRRRAGARPRPTQGAVSRTPSQGCRRAGRGVRIRRRRRPRRATRGAARPWGRHRGRGPGRAAVIRRSHTRPSPGRCARPRCA